VDGGGGFRLLVVLWATSLRFSEKRFRSDDLLPPSAGGSCGTGVEGCLGEGAGLYVCGLRMRSGSGSTSSGSSSGSGLASCSGSGEGEDSAGLGVRSRSCTSWKAGRVARIAGVMRFGSEGRFFNMDCRICRDGCGGEEGGEFMGEAMGEVLN